MRQIPIVLFLIFAALIVCGLVLPAHSDDTVNIDNQPVTPGEPAAQCYHDATDHLRKGAWFERAATQLKEAIRQDPKNVDYHLALGCAYADRVASLGWALAWNDLLARDTKQYPQDLADWQKDQTDPKADDYGQPAPIAPPAEILIKDDGKPLDLTRVQTGQQMQSLCKDALAEWKQAISLAANPLEKAKCEYVQGWGMLILEGYADPDAMAGNSVPQPIVISGFPTHKDIVAALEAATTDDPSQAIYWQSLGDILGRPSDDPGADDSSPDSGHSGMPAYRKALAIDPKNALLLYYLSQYEMRAHPDQAIADLKASIAADPTNAFPMYLLAADMMHQTSYEKNHRNNGEINRKTFSDQVQYDQAMADSLTDKDRATVSKVLALFDQASYSPFCRYPVYHPAVPNLLNAAYDYEFRGWFDESALSPLRDLARDLAGYADVDAMQGNLALSTEVDRELVTLGKKLIGDWQFHLVATTGHSFTMESSGKYIAGTGYADLVRNAQHYGNPEDADAFQAEYDAFTASWKTYVAAINAAGAINIYGYY